VSTDAIRAGDDGSPTTELVTGVVGDRCANCQSPLSPDQRYCVNCGERRGRPRFSYDTLVTQTAPAAAAEPPAPTRQRRFSSGATLVAGVATLLIALGVGVLIGHDSNSGTPARASAPPVITVNGGSGATAGTNAGANTTAATPATPTSTGTSKGKSGKVKVTHVVVSAKTAKAATQAASKVLGSSKNLSNNSQQQIGGSCSGGAGCQNGKFTGNFFPGG